MAKIPRLLKIILFIQLLAFPAFTAVAADFRVGSATTVNKFNDLVYHHVDLAFPVDPGGGAWSPTAWTAGIGVFERNEDTSSVYTFGPVWRFENSRRGFVEAAFSLTYLGHPRFRDGDGGRDDFGQHLQFMSRLSLGMYLDRAQSWSVDAGFMHVSNGGLSETNPGADFFSLEMRVAY